MTILLDLDVPDLMAQRLREALRKTMTDPEAYIGERLAAAMFEEFKTLCNENIGPIQWGVMEPDR